MLGALKLMSGSIGLTALMLFPAAARAAGAEDEQTIAHLGESKHTLIDAIKQAEKENGTAISAKFEFEDGKFWQAATANLNRT